MAEHALGFSESPPALVLVYIFLVRLSDLCNIFGVGIFFEAELLHEGWDEPLSFFFIEELILFCVEDPEDLFSLLVSRHFKAHGKRFSGLFSFLGLFLWLHLLLLVLRMILVGVGVLGLGCFLCFFLEFFNLFVHFLSHILFRVS